MTRIVSVVVLGSVQNYEQSRYAIFVTDRENLDLVVNENIEFLNEQLETATIVQGAVHKALILADFEADVVANDSETGDGYLPGILLHHLTTCRIAPDAFTVIPL